jgi:DNA-binding transcriptional LysR family regulator
MKQTRSASVATEPASGPPRGLAALLKPRAPRKRQQGIADRPHRDELDTKSPGMGLPASRSSAGRGTETSVWNLWFLRARLRTRHLLLLSAVGEEGNIGRAAEMLSMSQPAASRLLSDLEQIIGAELFERRPRGVKANWYGEALIRHARNALSSLTEAAAEIDALKAGRTGQVNLGCIGGPAAGLVPRALRRLAIDYPLVRVQVVVDTSDRLVQLLDEGRIDVMVGRLPALHDSSRFNYDRLGFEPVSAVVRKGHPLISGLKIDLETLAEAAWILPPTGNALRHCFESLFRDAGLPCPNRLVETVSPLIATQLLQQTDFIALQPSELAAYYAGFGMLSELPFDIGCNMDAFGVITRKGSIPSPAAHLMCEALEDEAAPSQQRRQMASSSR